MFAETSAPHHGPHFHAYYQDEVGIFSIDPVEMIAGSLGRFMTHAIHQVESFEIVASHTLRVRFEDGTEQTIHLWPILAGELYGPLRDPEMFGRVGVDPEVHTLVWPNGADFDPATLHDWPRYEQAFRGLARRWERARD